MYEAFYQLEERPFSITPNPRFVYLSQRHQDALAHLLYGVGRGGSGGFVQLTGEVGTGKTTLCRLLLEQIPEDNEIALILNPMLTPVELLRAICSELEIEIEAGEGNVQLLQHRLNQYLLERHARNQGVVLIIDEAQNMSRESLEQVRLLTNLETATDKLLQIILIGQPELRLVLARPELRQLSQRITARYHLTPLNQRETEAYVKHRLTVAGAPRCPFTPTALKALYQCSEGVPRLINIIADRALMAGYAKDLEKIDHGLVKAAAREIEGDEWDDGGGRLRTAMAFSVLLLVLAAGGWLTWSIQTAVVEADPVSRPAWLSLLENTDQEQAWIELAALWPGYGAAELETACQARESNGLMTCLRRQGSWAYIDRIGLPVILALGEGERSPVVLRGLSHDTAMLSSRGQSYLVPLRQLDRHWLGRFFVVWEDGGEILRAGDRGEAVARMKQLAAQIDEPPWTGGTDDRYDDDFRQWVIRFQRHHGISDDGMIGPETRLFMQAGQHPGPALLRSLDGES